MMMNAYDGHLIEAISLKLGRNCFEIPFDSVRVISMTMVGERRRVRRSMSNVSAT
jgi:hypothetical protein